MFLAAAVQLTSTSDEEANWESARALIERAAAHGARFVATPENTNYLGPHEEKVRRAEPLDGRTVLPLRRARPAASGSTCCSARSTRRATRPGAATTPASSSRRPGRSSAPTARSTSSTSTCPTACASPSRPPASRARGRRWSATPLGRFGLSICYDLRFGELYRRLVDDGAEILMIPSAFTLATGKDHWEPLLRARAIETQC